MDQRRPGVGALFLGLLSMRPNTTFAAEDTAAADTIVITWTQATGFNPAVVDVQRGDTVIWRKVDNVPLTLRSGQANALCPLPSSPSGSVLSPRK